MSEAKHPIGAATYISVALVFAILMGFGTWQMQRRAWKEALLRTIAERQALPPAVTFDRAALGCRPDQGLEDPCDFRPVRLTGRIADPAQVHIFISIPRQPNGLQGNGYWVFRQFEFSGDTAGRAARVWVNTGFVPSDQKDAAPPLAGRLDLTGVLRRAERRGRFSGANDMAKNVYFVRDPAEFPATGATETAYYVDMSGPVPPSGARVGLPYPMAGKQMISNRHLEYALTWYGLAATWLLVAGVAIRRRFVNTD
jgi:surfeit locus 1 family protein